MKNVKMSKLSYSIHNYGGPLTVYHDKMIEVGDCFV